MECIDHSNKISMFQGSIAIKTNNFMMLSWVFTEFFIELFAEVCN